jgi:hypothetical protein
VTAIIIVILVAAAIIGLGTAFGGPIIGAILAVVVVVGGIAWFAAMGGSKKTAGQVAREAPDREFLGPGGPDDPNA